MDPLPPLFRLLGILRRDGGGKRSGYTNQSYLSIYLLAGAMASLHPHLTSPVCTCARRKEQPGEAGHGIYDHVVRMRWTSSTARIDCPVVLRQRPTCIISIRHGRLGGPGGCIRR